MGVSDLGNVNIVVSANGIPTVNIKHLDDDGYLYKTGMKTESKITASGFVAHAVSRDIPSITLNLTRDSDEYKALETFNNMWFELKERPEIQIMIVDLNDGSMITGINMVPSGDHEGGRNSSVDQNFGMVYNGTVKKTPPTK